MIKEYDVVKAKKDLSDIVLKGCRGAVVMIHQQPKVETTQWTFNEYLRKSIDLDTRNYKIQVMPDQYGELINI